jgi:hypothetical protein
MQATLHQRTGRRFMNIRLVCLTLLCAAFTPSVSGQTTTYCSGAGHGITPHHDPKSASELIFDVTAVMDVVVFADATAEVQNERAFRELLAERCGPLLAIKTVDEAITHALENRTASSPISATLNELTARFVDVVGKNYSPEDPERYLEIKLRSDIENLRMAQQAKMTTTEREYLTRYAEEQEKRYVLMAPHCQGSGAEQRVDAASRA